MDTPSSPPCIFCGKDRDLSKATCPHCGRGWIDRRLPGASASWAETTGTVPLVTGVTPKKRKPDPKPGIAAAGDADPSAAATASATEPASDAAAATTPVEPTTAGGSEPTSRRTLIAVGVLAAAVVSFVVIGWIGSRGTDDPTDTPGALPTSTTGATDTGITTTTAPASTTTVVPPSTTTTTVPAIDAEGEAIAISDLSLGAFALGPLTFGTGDALGPLVATFGQPDSVSPAGTDAGLCPADSGIEVSWGPLTAVFTGDVDDAVLVGYRLAEADDHPAAELATLSGLNLGATVEELRSVYAGFDVSIDEEAGSARYVVVRGADGVTLLWGPLSSTDDDGIVEGIHSPEPCDGGPTTAP